MEADTWIATEAKADCELVKPLNAVVAASQVTTLSFSQVSQDLDTRPPRPRQRRAPSLRHYRIFIPERIGNIKKQYTPISRFY